MGRGTRGRLEGWRLLRGEHYLPVPSRIFLCAVFIEGGALIATAIATLTKESDEHVSYYMIMALSVVLFFIYFAVDGILKENVFQLWAFIFSSFLITTYVVYHYIRPTLGSFYKSISLYLLILVSVFQAGYIIMGIMVHEAFGWRLYKTVGSDVELGDLYREYQILLSLLKSDLQMGLVLVSLSGFFIPVSGWELALDVIVFLITFAWVMLGWQAVKRESNNLMRAFFVLSVGEPTYTVVKLLEINSNQKKFADVEKPQFLVSGFLALAVRVVVLVVAYRCWLNFGKGLKMRVFARIGARTPQKSPLIPSAGSGNCEESPSVDPIPLDVEHQNGLVAPIS